MHVLIANRGEIAARITRTARELDIETTVVHACDDRDGLHLALADHVRELPGSGPAAYLDQQALLDACAATGADYLHPGYGFLSENASFAESCAKAGLAFVGPRPETLRLAGDKSAARDAAISAGIPVLPATGAGVGTEEIAALLAAHPAGVMVKAVSGGGGRGIRAVRDAADLERVCAECAAEALAGFGDDALFAEALLPGARHIEVQVVGDGQHVVVLGDRDCTVQRRHQKLLEIGPAQGLQPDLRGALHSSAARLAGDLGYLGLGTVEFLVAAESYVFLEINPRIQVEHPVTEAVTGLDLVGIGLRIAGGALLSDVGITETPAPRGIAVEARVNAEQVNSSGLAVPSTGTVSAFAVPTGPGVRVDTHLRVGTRVTAGFDSLVAKVVTHSPVLDVQRAFDKLLRALEEFALEGVATNVPLLSSILRDPEFRSGPVDTEYLNRRLADFAAPPASGEGPLLTSPMPGVVVAVAEAGGQYASGEALVTVEAMKMRHVVAAPRSVLLECLFVSVGENVETGQPLGAVRPVDDPDGAGAPPELNLDAERADLAAVRALHRIGTDEARTEVVARRHDQRRRTARENIADLIDEGSFREYGALAVAAQSSRYSAEDLRAATPADGLVAGTATIDGAPAVVMSYDYTVLAGTQGARSHAKTDRMIRLAHDRRLPVVIFPEGGGGRPGDVDAPWLSGLDVMTFHSFGALRGRVPLVAVVSGRCFAGNAALAGMCDLVIATPDTSLGMAGPALIEGGGLGRYAAEQVGPVTMQSRNGVLDLVAADEADAVQLAKACLAYSAGQHRFGQAPDERLSRFVVPEDRLLAYDVRAAIRALADIGSVIELQPERAPGMVTCFVRVDGRPFGLVANDCRHIGGAINVSGARKMRGFLSLCDSWRLPLVSFCDTPGFMVGPDSEAEGAVRAFSDLFVAGAQLSVPLGTVILRKGYGLGAQAMAGGSFHAADFVVAWPTGEVGMMGLEGAVRLGFRKELEAVDDPADRQSLFEAYLAAAYAAGRATNAAAAFEVDDVIDPAQTRAWVSTLTMSG